MTDTLSHFAVMAWDAPDSAAIRTALAKSDAALKAEAVDLANFVARHFTLDQMISGAIAGYRDALGAAGLRS